MVTKTYLNAMGIITTLELKQTVRIPIPTDIMGMDGKMLTRWIEIPIQLSPEYLKPVFKAAMEKAGFYGSDE